MQARFITAFVVAITMGFFADSAARAQSTLVPSKVFARLALSHGEKKLAYLQQLQKKYGDSPQLTEVVSQLTHRLHTINKIDEELFTLIRFLGKTRQPRASQTLATMLKSRHIKVVMIAAQAAGMRKDPLLFEQLATLAKTPVFAGNHGFRSFLIEAIVRYDTPESIGVLIELLPAVKGRLSHVLTEQLSRKTGEEFGQDVEAWQVWWKKHLHSLKQSEQDNDRIVKAIEFNNNYRNRRLAYNRGRNGYEVPSYYGIPIHGKRIVFIIDCSSSMKDNGKLYRAKKELIRVVTELAPDAEFSIISFNAIPTVWKPSPALATAENKLQATKMIEELQIHYGTNICDTLDMALRVDANTETIFLLTDGHPTRGKIRKPAVITSIFSKENYFRRIVVNTIGIQTQGPFLIELARLNGGTFKIAQ